AGIDLAVRVRRGDLQSYAIADYERKPGELRHRRTPSIVLLGSSRAKYALVPGEFAARTGCGAYNLGIAGSKVVEWLTLSRSLFAVQAPRLVVLGVNASEFRADYVPVEAARSLFKLGD